MPTQTIVCLDWICLLLQKLKLWNFEIYFLSLLKNKTKHKNLIKIISQEEIQSLICYLRLHNIIGDWHKFTEGNSYGYQLSLSNKYCKNFVYFNFYKIRHHGHCQFWPFCLGNEYVTNNLKILKLNNFTDGFPW